LECVVSLTITARFLSILLQAVPVSLNIQITIALTIVRSTNIDTAVVYSTPAINPFYSAPIVFEGWPDRPPQSFQNQTDVKVPTSLAYSHENDTDQLPTAWGFGVNAVVQGAEPGSVQEYFKTRLQPDEKNIGLGSTDRCAKQLIKDHLRSLHDCIRSSFPGKIHEQAWGDAKILFVFIFPAIWTPETVKLFRSIAASAGFETPDGNHYVEARLSEPAAAAVHTVKSGMEGIKVSVWRLFRQEVAPEKLCV
jgi:hypothetical protein